MYLDNPDGITWRVKKVLAVALGGGEQGAGRRDQGTGGLPEVSDEEALKRGLEYIGSVDNLEKRERMTTVFKLYMEGKNTKELVAAAGVSKGSASNYLNDIETHIGCRIVRGRPEGVSLTALVRADNTVLRIERKGGKRDASVRDFHSFRVTWVTIALTGGMPLELVQKVTGHKTTEIVLKHYFQPGREAFRDVLNAAMPDLLTNGHKSPKDEILTAAKSMTAETWEQTQTRILELIKKM